MKNKIFAVAAAAVCVFTAACGADNGNEVYGTVTVIDRMGFEAVIPANVERIVSTAASNTEILAGLGAGDRLVLIDAQAEGVGGVNPNAVVADMFFAVNLEEIIAAEPCLVVASDINMRGGENPFGLLTQMGIGVVFIPTANLVEDISKDIMFLAEITQTAEQGMNMVRQMNYDIMQITELTAGVTEKRTVYFEISPAPWLFTAGYGTFINDLINLAGGRNVFDGQNGWFEPNEEAIITLNPDVILTSVDSDDAVSEILARSVWGGMNAVQNGRVYQINTDGASRATHNSIIALREIARALYPELF